MLSVMTFDLPAHLGHLVSDGITGLKTALPVEWADQMREDVMTAFWQAIQRPGGAVGRGPRRWYVEVHPQEISGFVELSGTLTASTGSWDTTPTSYAYQWQLCTSTSACSNITGGIASTHQVVAGELGKTIRVIVTATNGTGSTAATSAAVGPAISRGFA